MPVCRIPDWVPGAGFKKKVAAWARTLAEVTERPYQFVKQQMVLNLIALVFLLQFPYFLPRLWEPPRHHSLPDS